MANPRLRERSDRSLENRRARRTLGEVHALKDMRIVRTLPMDYLLSPDCTTKRRSAVGACRVRTITSNCPHNHIQLSAQSHSVVRTIVSRCPHNCLSLCAQLHLVVRTITSRCAHNHIRLSAQSALVVITIHFNCDHNLLRL